MNRESSFIVGEEVFFIDKMAKKVDSGAIGVFTGEKTEEISHIFRGKIESVQRIEKRNSAIMSDASVRDNLVHVSFNYIIRDNRKKSDSLHVISEEFVFPTNQDTIREKLDQKTKKLNEVIDLCEKLRARNDSLENEFQDELKKLNQEITDGNKEFAKKNRRQDIIYYTIMILCLIWFGFSAVMLILENFAK